MAASSRPRLSVDNSKIIIVSGYNFGRYDLDFVQDCWWILQSYIYQLPEDQRSEQIKNSLCVVNDTAHLSEVCERHIRKLHEMLLDMPVNGAGITRVVFAHSHGSRIVYEALKDASLLSFLKGRGINEPNERIKEIRAHLAVVTLGGIQNIPKVFAKICWNLLFANDLLAKVGKFWYGENHGQDVNVKEVGLVHPAIEALLFSNDRAAILGKKRYAEKHGLKVNRQKVCMITDGVVHPTIEAELNASVSEEEYLLLYCHLLANDGYSVPEDIKQAAATAYPDVSFAEISLDSAVAGHRGYNVPGHSVASPSGFMPPLPFVRHNFSEISPESPVWERFFHVRHVFKDYCTDASIREEIRLILGL